MLEQSGLISTVHAPRVATIEVMKGLVMKLISKQHAPGRSMVRKARICWIGRSQAIRPPKEFRFSGTAVSISRDGSKVILEEMPVERDAQGWPLAWWKLAGSASGFHVGERPRSHERSEVFGDMGR